MTSSLSEAEETSPYTWYVHDDDEDHNGDDHNGPCNDDHDHDTYLSSPQDSDLNKGTSGPCATFKSPSLSYLRSTNDTSFICVSCELYSLTTSLGSLDGLL